MMTITISLNLHFFLSQIQLLHVFSLIEKQFYKVMHVVILMRSDVQCYIIIKDYQEVLSQHPKCFAILIKTKPLHRCFFLSLASTYLTSRYIDI